MIRDKKKGCMYGLAIGDALGAAVEFRDPGTFPPVTGYRGSGPHGIEAGAWTDDTSMALALADSLAHDGSAKDQLERYVAWHQEGKYSVNGWCFDIGCTTKTALEDFVQKGNLQGPSEEWDSGNGSIMRLAPLVIKFHGCSDLYDKAVESSVVTHGSRLCKSACDFLAEFLEVLMDSSPEDDREDMLEYGNYEPEINKVIRWGWRDNQDIRGTGFVVQSLEAALWAFMTSNSFEETVLKAVNLGEDSDTTGAVAGQMAGAYWGFDAIPQSLVDGLARKDMIDLYLNPILLS